MKYSVVELGTTPHRSVGEWMYSSTYYNLSNKLWKISLMF